jgi:hypothetical protein
MPGVARSPSLHNLISFECTAPIKPEKCGLDGKSVGCVTSLQVASNVNRYRADSSGSSVGINVAVGASIVAVGSGVEVLTVVAVAVWVAVDTTGTAVAVWVVAAESQALTVIRTNTIIAIREVLS